MVLLAGDGGGDALVGFTSKNMSIFCQGKYGIDITCSPILETPQKVQIVKMHQDSTCLKNKVVVHQDSTCIKKKVVVQDHADYEIPLYWGYLKQLHPSEYHEVSKHHNDLEKWVNEDWNF